MIVSLSVDGWPRYCFIHMYMGFLRLNVRWLFLAGMVATPWGAFAQDNAFAKIASSSQAAVVKIEAKSADQEPRNCLGFFIGSREVMTSANCLEAIAGVRQFKP